MPSTARPSHLDKRASGTWPDKEKSESGDEIGIWLATMKGGHLRGRSVRSTDLTSVASTFSLPSSKFGIDFEEGEFRWRRDPRMALPWLPCSQRRPLVARISPKPARCGFPTLLAGPRLPCGAPRGRCASPDRHVCRRWRTLRCTLRRHPRPHTRCTDCPWAKAVCGSLVRRARRRQRRGVAARAASALPTHGSAGGRHRRRLCASRGRSSPDRLPGGGGGERSRVCAAGPLSRATARLPPPPPPRVRAALGSLLQPHRRGRRVRRSRQGACPKGEPPDPSRPLCGGAAALARRRRCYLASRDVPSGIARRRLLCGNVAVCSATRRCGGSALFLSRRPASGPGNTSCRRRGTLGSPLPARAADRAAAQSAAPSAASTAARRAALALAPAHALVACPPCRRARGDVRLSSKRSPSLTHSPGAAPPAPRRGRSRGLCALPTRGIKKQLGPGCKVS